MCFPVVSLAVPHHQMRIQSIIVIGGITVLSSNKNVEFSQEFSCATQGFIFSKFTYLLIL